VDYVDHEADVFVGVGLLFGEALPAAGPRDDALLGQLAVDATALGVLDGGRAAQGRKGDITDYRLPVLPKAASAPSKLAFPVDSRAPGNRPLLSRPP